jgi:trimeric autotransporter adhesin
VVLGNNSVASGPNTVSVGAPGAERRITNLAPGVNPTDAVTMSQLNSVVGQIGLVQRVAYSGVAMSGALSGLPQVEVGKKFSVGLGLGNYAGYSALAFGVSARIGENVVVKFGASTATGSQTMVNGGLGYSW